jgi:hypothetical protein
MSSYVIVDLDGTIFDLSHRLHFITDKPKNWNAFFKAAKDDTPIKKVVEVIRALDDAGYGLVFITGRSDMIREITQEALNKLFPTTIYDLYMRRDGDNREDSIVKLELLNKAFPESGDKEEILGVFEDRQQVVDMYRAQGLRVFQVATGKF